MARFRPFQVFELTAKLVEIGIQLQASAPANCIALSGDVVKRDSRTTYTLRRVFDKTATQAPSLVICSIVHDNLPAQEHAVELVIRGQGQFILDVLCFNHMINLVFIHSMRDCPDLNAFVELALSLQKFFKLAEMSVPSVQRTRWLYIVELIDFILSREEMLIAFVAGTENVDLEILGLQTSRLTFTSIFNECGSRRCSTFRSRWGMEMAGLRKTPRLRSSALLQLKLSFSYPMFH